MNLVALVLGVFLLGVAVYTASDPFSRARPWVSLEDTERAPERVREKQRWRTWLFAFACGFTGLGFVALGLAL